MAENQKPNAEQSGGKTEGCLVKTYDDKPCGRPIHHAPAGVDEMPVCLMHSRDPGKDDVAFQTEFERILQMAADGWADFTWFTFPSAPYSGREVKAKCVFFEARFTQHADFYSATFKQAADFWLATFTQDANFFRATFTGAADFSEARFTQDADFLGASFEDAAEFRETSFREDETGMLGPVFGLARFRRPEAVTFYKTYLGQALFHNCDISRLTFSDVRWRRRPDNGKRMLFEEVVDPGWFRAEALKPKQGTADSRNYCLIAELYQQLKKNYDDRRDYWTAGDFHYGEMEMKRLSSRRKNPILRWLHSHLGLAAWYKYASEYGESHVRPAVLLLLFLLVLFPATYPLIGLRPTNRVLISAAGQTLQSHQPAILSYTAYIRSGGQYAGAHSKTICQLLVDGEITSVDTALLRRNLAYEPVGGWGWLAMRLEFALAATLFALFLLAVRRQFRR